LALKNDGTVWAWGQNYYGQLGDKTATNRLTPVQVSGLTNVVSIAAGGNHSLALKSDGTVWAFGCNWYGQLGNGSSDYAVHSTPVQITGLTGTTTAIGAGANHTLAIKNDGTVWTFGYNGYGQLGTGNTTNLLVPTNIEGSNPNSTFLTFATPQQAVLENSGTTAITAKLWRPLTVPVTVICTGSTNGSLAGQPPVLGRDYALPNLSMTIPAGQTTGTISFVPIIRNVYNILSPVFITLGTPTNAVLGGNPGDAISIVDTNPVPTVQFTSATQSVVESSGTVTITAQLSGTMGFYNTVPFSMGGSAVLGTDYTFGGGLTTGTLQFGAGQTSASIAIGLKSIPGWKPDRTIIATLGAAGYVTLGAVKVCTLTITDDNPQPVSITTQPTNQTVNWSQTATFSVVASGTAPTYQWYKNGTAISGGTTASYTTPATVVGDNGAGFSVNVANIANSLTSATASLTVVIPSTPDIPGGLTAVPGNQIGSVNVNWTPSEGATSYQLERTVTSGSGYTYLTPISTTSYTDTSLTPGVTYYYRVSAINGPSQSAYSTQGDGVTLEASAVAPTMTPRDIWRTTHFGTTDTTGSRAWTANPSGDGISNLLKYALGLDPTKSYYPEGTAMPAMAVQVMNGSKYLTHTFTGTASDVTYIVEATSDISSGWEPPIYTHTGSAPGTVTVQDSQPMSASSHRFMRLRVTQP